MKLKEGYTRKKSFAEMQSYLEKMMIIKITSDDDICLHIFDEQYVINKKDLYLYVCQKINLCVKQLENKYVWVLYGMHDNSAMECLQVASSNNMLKEIKGDVKAMIADPLEKFFMDTYFYKNVFETYQSRYSNPIYSDMFKRYSQLIFFTIKVDKYLSEKEKWSCREIFNYTDGSGVERMYANYAEVKFAYETLAVYWNPFGIEHKIIEDVKRS